jgi:hypothetical protein
MSDIGAHVRQRCALVNGDERQRACAPRGATKLAVPGRTDREAGSDPMRAARGSEPVAIRTEGEPARCRPGPRTQGADLNGWLRIVSAPLRSYD